MDLLENHQYRPFKSTLESDNSLNLFNNRDIPQVITGRENILRTAVSLLKTALEDKELGGGEVVLTFH
jgi:hypothetical protein